MVSSNRIAASKGEALSIWLEINQRLVTLLIRASAGNDQSAQPLRSQRIPKIHADIASIRIHFP